MNRTLKTLRHIMHYGRMRLPLAKRIRRERIIDVEYNRFFMLWDVLPDRNDKQLRKQLYVYANLTSPYSLPIAEILVCMVAKAAGGKKNQDLYDAPNLPKYHPPTPPPPRPPRQSLIPDNIPKPKRMPIAPKNKL